MAWRDARRVGKDEVLPTEDASRPVQAPSTLGRYMLNTCRVCGKYKWVYCDVDLRDGKGPGYVCGRCLREAREAQATVAPTDMDQVRR